MEVVKETSPLHDTPQTTKVPSVQSSLSSGSSETNLVEQNENQNQAQGTANIMVPSVQSPLSSGSSETILVKQNENQNQAQGTANIMVPSVQSSLSSESSEANLNKQNDQETVNQTQEQGAAAAKIQVDDFYDSNPMWKEIMISMQCFIDDHIARILHLSGYRSYASLKKFKDTSIDIIEQQIQGGKLLNRVDVSQHYLYLGGVKDYTLFSFLEGEKDLIRSIVDYVSKNHKEKDKPLGKSILDYPIFNKNKRINSSQEDSESNKRSKSAATDTATVVSLDFHSEALAIKRIVKDYFIKQKYPDDYLNTLSTMTISVKTVEKEDGASLSASFNCPICNGKNLAAGYRDRNKTWTTSNLNRHFNSHLKKKDKLPGTVDNGFFRRRRSSTTTGEDQHSDIDADVGSADDVHMFDSDHGGNTPPRTDSASSLTAGIVNCNILMREGENSTSLPDSISIACDKNKYSRSERTKRALGRHTSDQTRLTVYFPILNKIEVTLRTNQVIISELEARCQELTLKKPSSSISNVSYLLRLLMETAEKNVNRKAHGHRYEEEIKLFAVYLFIIGGRMLYEFLLANLEDSLPSITEVERILKKNSNPVIEGVFRFQELKDFLVSHKLPLKVCISEDGTRIQQKFQYDSTTNQIIGPVLPLAEHGVPISGSFPAISAAAIATHMKSSDLSSTAYAIMAQPLRKGSPSFCLSLFGTDNRFSAEHTFRRWSFISEELAKVGVEVECFSADGDPKLLSAMHSLLFSSKTNFKEQWKDWFFAKNELNFTVIQDAIHTVNKFRARLNPSTFMPIGNFSVSITHLRLLIKEESKEKHGLTDQDLNNSDKMNFNASFKICTSRVTDLMALSIPGSDATVEYLSNMRYVVEACLDDGLSAAERLYRIWHCVFFLRFWKLWLRNHKSYTMENFITSNLYVCVEVIAHALIIILIKFRDSSTPEFYLPNLFSSQACESFFRLARSMTSTESTVINFSMKEFLSKVRRVDMLHHCVSKLYDKLEFPREKRKKLLGILHEEKHQDTYLPNDSEILEIVMTAKNDAIVALGKLGVQYYPTTSLAAIRNYLSAVRNFEDDFEVNSNSTVALDTIDLNFTEDDIPLDILAAFPSPDEVSSLDPTSTSEDEEVLPPNSIYTMVPKSGGGFVKIRKSTFCWLIMSNGLKLSSDRLQRVRQAVCTSMSNLNFNLNNPASEPFVIRKEEIEGGDWCIFRKTNGSGQCALVLGFRYLSGSGCAYSRSKAPVNPPPDKTKARGLGCLCTRYNYNASGELKMVKSSVQCYLNMNSYVASISKPILCNSKLCLPPLVLTFLSDM